MNLIKKLIFLAAIAVASPSPAGQSEPLDAAQFFKRLPKKLMDMTLRQDDEIGFYYARREKPGFRNPMVFVSFWKLRKDHPKYRMPERCAVELVEKGYKLLECKYFYVPELANERGNYHKKQQKCDSADGKLDGNICYFQWWSIWTGSLHLAVVANMPTNKLSEDAFTAVSKEILQIKNYQVLGSEGALK